MSKLPRFRTLDELVDFWDSHSFTDYLDQMEQTSPAEAMPGRVAEPLRVQLDKSLHQRLAELAARKGLSVDGLARLWLEERLVGVTSNPTAAFLKDAAETTYHVT